MVNRERLVQEFMELVAVDSESGEERQIADLLKIKLTELGLKVYEDNAGDVIGTGTGNLIATLPGKSKNLPTAFFSAHMDTVKPGKGIEPVLKNGVITSKGDTILGGDDKAGIAAILEAIRILQEQEISHGDIQVIFSVFEEGGLRGVKNLDFSKIKADFGFVLDCDGSPGTIISRAPAQNNIKVLIRGKAAHAGMCPEEGINAILVASEAIANMKLGRIDEETTANIGLINGGKATNIIPEEVTIEGEARSTNQDKLNIQTEHMCETFRAAAEKYEARAAISVELVYANINLMEKDSVMNIAISAAKSLGIGPIIKNTGGGSDANIFNGKNIPTANLGIGMNKVHTTDENIKVEDLEKTALYLIQIIKEINKKN